MYMKAFSFSKSEVYEDEPFSLVNMWIRENAHHYKVMNISPPVMVDDGAITFLVISVVYVER